MRCLNCGGRESQIFSWYCGPCNETVKQTKLLRENNWLLRQNSSGSYSPAEEASSSNHKEDFWIPLLICICLAVVMLTWELVKWCVDQVKIFFSWIGHGIASLGHGISHGAESLWHIVSWPFIFLWTGITTIYVWLTKLIGWSHPVKWWEVVLFLLFVLWLISLIDEDEKK